MSDLKEARELLDEINRAIADYDPVLKEKARDIMLERAFGARVPARSSASGTNGRGRSGREGSDQQGGDLASLLSRWTPTSMSDKALLGAYSLTRGRGEATVTSQAINAELKRNGLAVSNITRAIEGNMRASQPLMVQEGKKGATKQARKQYRVTPAGTRAVEGKLGT